MVPTLNMMPLCWAVCQMQGIEKDSQPEHEGKVTKGNKTNMLPHLGIAAMPCWWAWPHLDMTSGSYWHLPGGLLGAAWAWLHRFCLALLNARGWTSPGTLVVPTSTVPGAELGLLFVGRRGPWAVCRPLGFQASRLQMKHTLPQTLSLKLGSRILCLCAGGLRTCD